MTTELTLKSGSGKDYVVELPDPKPNFDSKYVFAFAKSGSTLLDNLISVYCQQVNVPTFSLFNQAFGQGLSTGELGNEALPCFEQSGTIFTGFRHYPNFELDICKNKAIWLVRDPRDMAVSMFYSVAKSHVIPKGNKTLEKLRQESQQFAIDVFALQRIDSYVGQFKRYRAKLTDKNVTIYRYEDVIYKKIDWLKQVIETLGIEFNRALLEQVVEKFNVIPSKEQEEQHIRQVHPGNYKQKLQPETIDKMNAKAAEFLGFFNYEA